MKTYKEAFVEFEKHISECKSAPDSERVIYEDRYFSNNLGRQGGIIRCVECDRVFKYDRFQK